MPHVISIKKLADSTILLSISRGRKKRLPEDAPLYITSKAGMGGAKIKPASASALKISYQIELFPRGNAAGVYRGVYEIRAGEERLPLRATKPAKLVAADGYSYVFSMNKKGLLDVRVHALWGEGEKTKEERDANAVTAYAQFRELPINDNEVFFESMATRSFNDNPRAIYEELAKRGGYSLVWGLSNEKTDVGQGGTAVRYRSLEYWRHLATAKYIVSNLNQLQLVKRPEQIVVQTMHGIPLKHMGLIVTKKQWKIDRMKQLFGEDWDYFVTPCDYMSDILRGPSYEFKHTFIESGYPRNDFLIAHKDDSALIERVRLSLGVPEGKKVIFWAPTWRTKKRFDEELDLDLLKAEFGDEYVLVLRAHYLEEQFVPTSIYNDFVLNGHLYENVNDMLIAADVLITDYSSIMFDFSLLRRPMVLYMWDYERYIKKKRGTYFDPAKDYPELVAFSSEEVVEKLKSPAQLMEGVDAFHERFNQYETGHAAHTVVDTVWGTAQSTQDASTH